MECSSPRDWDGLAESSWTCFPHYAFSRLNSSVSFIPGFWDVGTCRLYFPLLFQPFLKSLGYSLEFFILHSNTGHLAISLPPIPLPYPLLFLETQSSPGAQKCFYAASIPGVVPVLPAFRVILPCSGCSVQPSWAAPFSGELCSLGSTWHQLCKPSKNLVPLKIPSVCQV